MSKAEIQPAEILYPESDGKPVAETDLHRELLFDLVAAADAWFREDPLVYVSGNLLLYYVEGHPEKCISPDVFVVRGVPKGKRRTYKVWVEGKAPDVVIELTSRSTHGEDLREKRSTYARLGVREYYIFDPEGEAFDPPFRGFRLDGGTLREIPPTRIEGAKRVFSCDQLGLELHGLGPELRWVDPSAGRPLPVTAEVLGRLAAETRRARRAEARAGSEAARAQREAARAKREVARAKREASRAKREAARAEREAARAERAEAELARLRAELSRRPEGPG